MIKKFKSENSTDMKIIKTAFKFEFTLFKSLKKHLISIEKLAKTINK